MVHAVHCSYGEIIGQLGEPRWFNEVGAPRYVEFSPHEAADIYADQVLLLAIACQSCGRAFTVSMSQTVYDRVQTGRSLDAAAAEGALSWGDPPNIGCCAAGPTMTSEARQVLQFWDRSQSRDFVRRPELEGELSDSFADYAGDEVEYATAPEQALTDAEKEQLALAGPQFDEDDDARPRPGEFVFGVVPYVFTVDESEGHSIAVATAATWKQDSCMDDSFAPAVEDRLRAGLFRAGLHGGEITEGVFELLSGVTPEQARRQLAAQPGFEFDADFEAWVGKT